MSQKSHTPDEKLMIAFYKKAEGRGDFFQPLDVAPIARTLGQREIAMKNIVKHLAQANFLQKVGETRIRLTEHGCKFVRGLLEEL